MIIVIDGPPASGKSTVAEYLRRRHGFSAYRYKRLGLVNTISTILLLWINLRNEKVRRYICDKVDPVILVSPSYLEKLSWLFLGLEIVYKCVRYAFLFLLALMNRDIVIDEWFSLGWANYLNLMLYKKALKPRHVELLMRLDLSFLRVLSKFFDFVVLFIDRDLVKLRSFWFKRGHRLPYDVGFAMLVKYSFNLFRNSCTSYGTHVKVKYVYLA